MRRLVRLAALAVSILVVLCVVATAAVVVLLRTPAGQEFIRSETTAVIEQMLGSAYAAELGHWSFELRPNGLVAVDWRDVAIRRKGRPGVATTVANLSVGLRLAPLLGGRLEFGRLEVRGARLDLASLDDGRSGRVSRNGAGLDLSIARNAADVLAAIDRRFASLRAFHFEEIALSDIVVTGLPEPFAGNGPALIEFAELHRSGSGELEFLSGISIASFPVSVSGRAMPEANSGRMASLSFRAGAFDLSRFVPTAPPSDTTDERPFGSDAKVEIAVVLTRDPESGIVDGRVDATAGAGALQFGSQHTRLESAAVSLAYREGEETIQLLPSRLSFDGANATIEGEIRAADAGQALPVKRLAFRINSDEVNSSVGLPAGADAPLTASVRAQGYFDPAKREVRVSVIDMEGGGGRIRGSAVYRYGSPTALTSLRLVASSFPARAVKAFWPINAGGKARAWVLAHSGDAGRLARGLIALDIRNARLPVALRPENDLLKDELRLTAELEGARLLLEDKFPALSDVRGRIQARGSRTTVEIDGGVVEAPQPIVLKPSLVTLFKNEGPEPRPLQAEATLRAAGSLPALVEAAEQIAPGAAIRAGLTPEAAHGNVGIEAEVKLALGDAVPDDEELKAWSARATLADVSLDQPVEGRVLSGMNGTLTLAPSGIVGDLNGAIDGIPADLRFSMPLDEAAKEPRTLDVELALTAEKAAEAVPALKGVLGGSVHAVLSEKGDGMSAELDLGAASIDLPMIAWSKGRGIPAALSFSVEHNEEQTSLKEIRLAGDGFAAFGSAVADASGLRTASLHDVSLNPGDDVSVSVSRTGNGYSVDVKGTQLDARPILQELRSTIGQKSEKRIGGGTFDISASIDRVNGFGGQAVTDFFLNYASDRGQMAALSLSGSAGRGGVTGDLSPRKNGRAIRIAVKDLGALMSFTGLYGRMEGGSGTLNLVGSPENGYRGTVKVMDFTLVDEPRLSNIVGSSKGGASLQQAVGRDLRTERAFFDQASANLQYDENGLRVADGIVRGPLFGSSFAGTLYDRQSNIDISGSFMPAYGINRVFGAIPLFGQILGNGNEGGLIGITYNLSGAFDTPTLSVNPISAIAPGIFRQIFAYQ